MNLADLPRAPHAGPKCPACGSARVETTLHLVFRRVGATLFPQQDATGIQTCCNDCGAEAPDEQAEALLHERYPEAF